MKCDKCENEIHIGEWPYCPHGRGNNLEQPMESVQDWNISPEEGGVEFTTRGQRRKYMDNNGIDYRKMPKVEGSTLYFDQKVG